MGDLKAMLGALEHRRDRALASWPTASASTTSCRRRRICRTTRRRNRRTCCARFRTARYEFWDYMDDDFVSRIPVRIRVRVTAKDGEIELDLSGTDPQVKAGYNVPTHEPAHLLADLPLDELHHDVRSGDPEERRACIATSPIKNQKGQHPQRRIPRCGEHSRQRALSTVRRHHRRHHQGEPRPDAGRDRRHDDAVRAMRRPSPMDRSARSRPSSRCAAAWARFNGRDGVDARDNSLNNMRNHPLELVEATSSVPHPGLRRACRFRWARRWRGGVGQMITAEVLCDGGIILARGLDRMRLPAWGVPGGMPGGELEAIYNAGAPTSAARQDP